MVDYERVPSGWDHMNPGMGLAPGQSITSELLTADNGWGYKQISHALTYQEDGNLVLYRTTYYGYPEVGGAPNFADVALKAAAAGQLPDGQVGDADVEAVWSTGTDGRSAGAAVMQADGNFVVYDAGDQPVWASGTQGAADYVWVRVQRDGNLVLYKGHAPGEGADQWVSVWATGTQISD